MVVASPAATVVLLVLYLLLLGAAAVSDLARFTISNWVCVALAGLMLAAMAAAPADYDWARHLGAAAAALAGGAVAFRFGWLGGGDAKLFAAVALWAGVDRLIELLIATVLAGGLLAAALILLRGLAAAAHAEPYRPRPLPRLLWPGEGVPYGIAIAAGGAWLAPDLPAFAGLF